MTQVNRKRASKQTSKRMMQIEAIAPKDPDQLQRFVRVVLGLQVPSRPIVQCHSAPIDYLIHAFFEDLPVTPVRQDHAASPARNADRQSRDCVVWASRGGGKTMLGAVATLLDMLYKPGVQIRILGGSMEQSSKMYRYLLKMLDAPMLRGVLAGQPTQKRVELVNGSVVEVLSQSQKSVRGTRVHKIRCDEVEEFKPEIWQAAQLVTRSSRCGNVLVNGSVEALSTMHRPYGLMSRLIEKHSAGSVMVPMNTDDQPVPISNRSATIFRWCAIDVIKRCPRERNCETCVLWTDCQGRAKEANGFVSVDDLIWAWKRSSKESWASEMMCQRPRRSDSVYPNFSHDRHAASGNDNLLPLGTRLIAGMDFGLRSPLVMLWARVSPIAGNPEHETGSPDLLVEILDEYVEEGLILEQHLLRIESRNWPMPDWIGVDPAGAQRNSHSGKTDIQMLRGRGYKVRAKRTSIQDGVERIRRRLDRGTLRIAPSCVRLIEAMTMYHFDADRPEMDSPVKDGPDHLCDALRYMILNLELEPAKMIQRSYL